VPDEAPVPLEEKLSAGEVHDQPLGGGGESRRPVGAGRVNGLDAAARRAVRLDAGQAVVEEPDRVTRARF
jgi:hypothetical protein